MPEVAQQSWADRLKNMNSDRPAFTPLEVGRYNFRVVESSVQDRNNGKGEYINMKVEVASGDRKNFKLYHSVYPNAQNVYFFTQFYEATGLGINWLAESNPTIGEIASNFLNREFSADVVNSNDVNPKTNKPYQNLANFERVEASTPSQQSAPQNHFNGASAPSPAPTNESPSPWGDTSGAPSNPFS